MNNFSQKRNEARYGILPTADQILFNPHYILGYPYYFGQANRAFEIVDPGERDVGRIGNFKSDYRVSEHFRIDLTDYRNFGQDSEYLVANTYQQN